MGLTIYLLRHGQTTLSRDDSFCGSGLDPELTPAGVEMAQAFAEAYRSRAWSAIYSSPMRRTVASAQPICDLVGLKLETEPGLREIAYGKWEGLTKAQVKLEYEVDYVNWLSDPARYAPTGGELATDVARRATGVIEKIKQRFSEGNVLVVSHKATIRIILCELLGIEIGRFRYRLACPVSSVSVVEFTDDGPLLLSLGDRSHLNERLQTLPGT